MPGGLLNGVRVLDLTRLLPGPLCTQHLADLGAEVIKVEDTRGGDYARQGLGTGGDSEPDYFALVNRGKRSLGLDLKQESGRAIFLDLVATADLVIEGFRPGVMDRLGIGFKALQASNSKIVLCSITGYGQSGPFRDRAGHDLNYCALTGLIDQTGQPSGEPVIPAFQIADLAGGTLTALASVLAGLFSAQRSGKGCYIDVAMTDGVMANLVFALALRQSGATDQLARGQGALNGGLPCYGVYRTADGRHLSVAALERKFWDRLCRALDRPDLIQKHGATGVEANELRRELERIFAQQPLEVWIERLAPADCCVEPVLHFDEALKHPHFVEREVFLRDDSGDLLGFAFPTLVDGARLGTRAEAPQYCQHSQLVLAELGYSEEKIASLVASETVRVTGS